MIKISTLKNNPNNPRTIKKDALEKLKKSISDFPEMMEKRPMVCVTDAADKKIFPLGGNMRLKAIRELGFKEVPKSWIMMADDWTEEKRKEFIIKDNVSIGDWDFEDLTENWDVGQLEDWGVEVPKEWKQIDEVVEDDFDAEPKKETDIVLGDLFEIGEHRLLCGDSTILEKP